MGLAGKPHCVHKAPGLRTLGVVGRLGVGWARVSHSAAGWPLCACYTKQKSILSDESRMPFTSAKFITNLQFYYDQRVLIRSVSFESVFVGLLFYHCSNSLVLELLYICKKSIEVSKELLFTWVNGNIKHKHTCH